MREKKRESEAQREKKAEGTIKIRTNDNELTNHSKPNISDKNQYILQYEIQKKNSCTVLYCLGTMKST